MSNQNNVVVSLNADAEKVKANLRKIALGEAAKKEMSGIIETAIIEAGFYVDQVDHYIIMENKDLALFMKGDENGESS